jgi:dimethylargininase
MKIQAWVRNLSPQLGRCELSFLERAEIDLARARQQHAAYLTTLEGLGCELLWLKDLPEHPDGVFVEDTAVLVPELAVLTRPGARSRQGEVESVAAALASRLPLAHIEAPGTLEGGDVLRIGRRFFVGASARSNAAGVTQLRTLLAPYGYTVDAVPLRGCLHLKSAVTFIPPDVLVVNPDWVEPQAFGSARVVAVDPTEPYGANTLTIGATTLVSDSYPRTRERLEQAGVTTGSLQVAELHKAEAALTCLSLLLER